MPTIPHGNLVVSLPDEWSAEDVTIDEVPGDDPLVASLAASDEIRVTHAVTVSVSPNVVLATEATGRPESVVTVRSSNPHDVLLYERDGCFWWSTSSGDPIDAEHISGVRTLATFSPAAPPEVSALRSADRADAGGGLRVLAFHLPDAGDIVRFVESKVVKPGLVSITHVDPRTWRQLPPEDFRLARTGARVLLLVHGTFATTTTGFGLIGGGLNNTVVATALERYDAVIGFTHRTLSEDPEQNGQELVALLGRLNVDTVDVDILTHSRGALVARSAIELVGMPGKIVMGKLVMVAGPNDGTLLARKENWSTLFDLYTTLAVGVARQFGGPIVAEATRVVVTLVLGPVRALITTAVSEDQIPGLAAMVPGSDFLRRLNRIQPRPGGSVYLTVVTDFEPSAVTIPQEPALGLLERLADDVVDPLMGEANDLVVNTTSMSLVDGSQIPPPEMNFVPRSSGTEHVTYFVVDESIAIIDSLIG